MTKLLVLVVALLLAGCATNFPNDRSKWTAEQIKADAADKNAGVNCWVGRNMTGTIVGMSAQLDKLAINSGSITVEPGSDCKTTITADPKPVAKAASAP